MTTWAHVSNGAVVELTDIDPAGRFNPALLWVACDPAVVPGWTYNGTAFAAPVIPPPPPPTADQVLAQKIAAGIAITSTGTPALDATYALDALTMEQIKSVASDFQNSFGLPGNLPTFTYPDISGQPRTFTGAQLVALYRAQRDLLFVLNSQAAIMAHGGSPSWPVQTASIPA